MNNQEVSRQQTKIISLLARVNEACGDNIELRADWAKYICVCSAGLLENSIKLIYSEYARKKVAKPVANFVESKLSTIRNPKFEKFCETAAAFNESWVEEIVAFAGSDGRGDAIDTIMGNRHLIAHGKGSNSNITIRQIQDYLKKSIEVLEFIEMQCHV